MTFPSLQSAVDYLQNRVQDFYQQGSVLTERIKTIRRLKEAAMQTNNQQALGQLNVLQSGVVALLEEQLALERKLEPFAEYFGLLPAAPRVLGALPIVLAGSAIAVAVGLYLHFEKLQNQAKALELVAKGILPAAQADSILNPSFFSGLSGSFASIGLFAIGGLFLFFFLTRRNT